MFGQRRASSVSVGLMDRSGSCVQPFFRGLEGERRAAFRPGRLGRVNFVRNFSDVALKIGRDYGDFYSGFPAEVSTPDFAFLARRAERCSTRYRLLLPGELLHLNYTNSKFADLTKIIKSSLARSNTCILRYWGILGL